MLFHDSKEPSSTAERKEGARMDIMDIGVGIFLVWLVRTLHNSHPESARLSGIDCPEKGQAFCSNAKQGGR
jgi:hypothetical protein